MYEQTIRTVMEINGISPENVPEEPEITSPKIPQNIARSKRYFRTKAFAMFKCSSCKREWPSAHAWSVLDLKEQRFCCFYYQECNQCENKVKPKYDAEAVVRMVKWACKVYQIRMGLREPDGSSEYGDDDDEGEENSRGPHDQERCELCRLLGRPCWQKRH